MRPAKRCLSYVAYQFVILRAEKQRWVSNFILTAINIKTKIFCDVTYEDGGSRFLRNDGTFLPDYTASVQEDSMPLHRTTLPSLFVFFFAVSPGEFLVIP